MTRIRGVLFVLVVFGTAACGIGSRGSDGAGAGPDNGAHFGVWSVTRVLAGTPDGGGAEGATAELTAASARFGDRTCTNPTYARRWMAAEAFRDAYGVDPAALGLPPAGEVTLIDVECAAGDPGAGRMLI